MAEELCHCGKPLHYPDLTIQRRVEAMVSDWGRTRR